MSIKLLFFPFSMIVLVWSMISFTKPAWDDYNVKKAEVIKLSAEKQELESGIENIENALLQYTNLDGPTKSYVANAIPVDGDDDNLVAELNKGISQSGILVTKISANRKASRVNSRCKQNVAAAGKKNTECKVKALHTKMSVSLLGTYPSIKEFLGKLDVQNRLIIPNSVSLVLSKNRNKDEDKEVVDFISAKIDFDILQKKPIKAKSFSQIMDSDDILRSLLNHGLSDNGLRAVNKFITSEVFIPVHADGAGKDNLFEDTLVIEVEPT